MSRTMKKSILQDQQVDHALIRKQNEQNLSKALTLFQNYKQLQTQSQLEQVTESLSTVEFLKKNCPEGGKLQEFVQFAARYFQYELFQMGSIVFNYGDYGDKMYIILKGEVAVLLPRAADDIENDIEWMSKQATEWETSWGKRRSNQVNLVDQLMFKLGETTPYCRAGVPTYSKVFQYYSGQSFGDVALNSDKPRSASILVTSPDCHLISINRADYKMVCEKSIQEMTAKIDYFMKLLPGNGKFSVSKFLQSFHPITFSTGTILWREGEEPKFFFLILKGRVELFKHLEEDALLGKPPLQAPESQFTKKPPRRKKVILSQLSDNNFVGQEELIEGQEQRQYSCQVADITSAYYMEAEDFVYVKKSYPEIVRCLREKSTQIAQYMTSRQVAIAENLATYHQSLGQADKKNSLPGERRLVSDIFKQEEARPDQNHLRSYKPKILSCGEITNQNIKVNIMKSAMSGQEGDFVMLDNAIIEKLRDRLQRMQIVSREPEKKERVKTTSIDDARILVSRIQSAVSKRRIKFSKWQSEHSMCIKSMGSESNAGESIHPSTPSLFIKRSAVHYRKQLPVKGHTASSKHLSKQTERNADFDIQVSPLKRIHTAQTPSSGAKRKRIIHSSSGLHHNLLF